MSRGGGGGEINMLYLNDKTFDLAYFLFFIFLLFKIYSCAMQEGRKEILYLTMHSTQDSTYHSLCYTSCGALAGMSAMQSVKGF